MKFLVKFSVTLQIRDPRVLEFFGFRVIEPVGRVLVEQPISAWLRCLWWKWTR